jgi:preprotein translocase subunit SecG
MNFLLYTTFILFLLISIFLILLILIQKGRGGGLASAFGGGGGNTAFGSKTGDVLTWATSVVFGIFLALAIALNIIANKVNTARFGAAAAITTTSTPAGPGGPAGPAQGGQTSVPQVPPGSTDPGVLPKGPTTSK